MRKGKANNRQHRDLKCRKINGEIGHSIKTKRPKGGFFNRMKDASNGVTPKEKVRSHKNKTGKPNFKPEQNMVICDQCHRAGELDHYWGKWAVCKTCAIKLNKAVV